MVYGDKSFVNEPIGFFEGNYDGGVSGHNHPHYDFSNMFESFLNQAKFLSGQ